ncbi:hypothetical protein BK799_21300 [Rhodococcus sp. D-1]|nr:hypothetical protein BK799_21300 [Rhodococcus sp. D-1]
MGNMEFTPHNEYERLRCIKLLESLLVSTGDRGEIKELLHNEMLDGPAEYFRVITSTSEAFFCSAWPSILEILGDAGVSHKRLLELLELKAQSVVSGGER